MGSKFFKTSIEFIHAFNPSTAHLSLINELQTTNTTLFWNTAFQSKFTIIIIIID